MAQCRQTVGMHAATCDHVVLVCSDIGVNEKNSLSLQKDHNHSHFTPFLLFCPVFQSHSRILHFADFTKFFTWPFSQCYKDKIFQNKTSVESVKLGRTLELNSSLSLG